MNTRILLSFFVPFMVGCATSDRPERTPSNRWADVRLWPVLEAQEHRDMEALCALLKDSSATVREAAALAFASVQDTLGIPCLLTALRDDAVAVRATAVFALGFVADSLAIGRMAELALNERDSTVQRAYLSASFLTMQRKGTLKDPQAIIYFLQSSSGQDRVRAADALRRLPDSVLVRLEEDYVKLVEEEQDADAKATLIRGTTAFKSERVKTLLIDAMTGGSSLPVRVSALRALGTLEDPNPDVFFNAMKEAPLAPVALAVLEQLPVLDADHCMAEATLATDPFVRIALLGLAIEHGGQEPSGIAAASTLASLSNTPNSPYLGAALIAAKAKLELPYWSSKDRAPVLQDTLMPAILRQATFQSMLSAERLIMMRSRYATREAQYAGLRRVVATTLATQDAGLICAVGEFLADEDAEVVALLLPIGTEQVALEALRPIRDLEAIRLLQNAVAKRDGLPPPNHQAPPFNHAINKEKHRALPQGQRYRITTEKGLVIIATDVNECPGSSLAFDSLVVAGYYNGKAFHRMVPNFVVQGGCPRGDGYGGMPWTLRTEIGRKLFTAGSVGLASAGRDTESCQFFITHSATPHLDGRYTRFGEVVEGMDVVWRLQVGDVMEKVERIK